MVESTVAAGDGEKLPDMDINEHCSASDDIGVAGRIPDSNPAGIRDSITLHHLF